MKKLLLVLLIALYVGAGINHFWHPQFYIHIIPPYLPAPSLLNITCRHKRDHIGCAAHF